MIDAALLPALQDALVVAQTGSVQLAAKRLHKTSSAVSQQLRRLQDALGVDLFERAGRGIRLSATGQAALPNIMRLFDHAEVLFASLGELGGQNTMTLRIAASDYLGKALLVPVLQEIVGVKSPLRFELTTTHSAEAVRWLSRGEGEIAIVTTAEAGPGQMGRVLFKQTFAWVCPKRPGKKALRERLASEPIVRLSHGSEGRRLLDTWLEKENVRPVSTIDVPSVSLLLTYVTAGVGAALVPALALVDADLRHIEVEPVRIPALPVRVLWREDYAPTGEVGRFVERLTKEGQRAGRQAEAAMEAVSKGPRAG